MSLCCQSETRRESKPESSQSKISQVTFGAEVSVPDKAMVETGITSINHIRFLKLVYKFVHMSQSSHLIKNEGPERAA